MLVTLNKIGNVTFDLLAFVLATFVPQNLSQVVVRHLRANIKSKSLMLEFDLEAWMILRTNVTRSNVTTESIQWPMGGKAIVDGAGAC